MYVLPACPELPSPAAARYQLGSHLRTLRRKASLDIARAAGHVGIVPSTLSRIETGQAPTRLSYLHMLLDLYDITDPDQRRQLAELARHTHEQPYWTQHDEILPEGTAQYLALEAAATTLRTYAPACIPDQLHTAWYAQAASAATRPDLHPRHAATVAALTLARQDQLRQHPCQQHILIEETALRRLAAPAPVTAGQHRHLAELAASPAITIQAIRYTASRAVLSPPFTLLTLPAKPHPAGCYHGPAGQIATTRRLADTIAMTTTWQALTRAALTPEATAVLLTELAGL